MDIPAAPSKASVFVSYSRKDTDFVAELCEALKRDGREVWVDLAGIPPTAEWLESIYRAIEAHDACLFVLSPDYVASPVCGLEITHAATNNKRLVPLLLRNCEEKAVPDVLRRLNWIIVRDASELSELLVRLNPALDTDLPWVQTHARLLVRAQNWDATGRDGSRLLRGRDLKEAEAWLAKTASHSYLQPSPLHLEYLAASRQADTRRQRVILGSTAAALAVSIGLAIWAFSERNVARNQTHLSVANSLLIESQNDSHRGDRGTQLRVLLAVESLQRLLRQGRDSTEALETVDAIASLRARQLGSTTLATAPEGVILSGRGERVATWSGSRVEIRDTVGMVKTHEIVPQRNVTAAAFDPLATMIAIGTDDYVELHALGAENPAPILLQCKGRPHTIRMDASGTRGLSLTLDAEKSGRFCLWSTNPARTLVELPVASKSLNDSLPDGNATFSADSAFVGAVLPTAEYTSRAVLFDAKSGKQLRSWDLDSGRARIAFRGDRLIIADDTSVWSWGASEDREMSRWNLDERARVRSLSADGRFAVVNLESGTSWVMDDFSYERFGVFDTSGGTELAQMEYAPSFTPDGRYLMRSDELREFPSMRLFRVIPQQAGATSSVMSDDTAVAVTVGKANELMAWTLAGSPQALRLPLHPDRPTARAWSPHGPWFAYAWERDVRLVNLLEPANVATVQAEHRIEGLRVSGHNRFLIAVGESGLTLWDLPGLRSAVHIDLGQPLPIAEPCALLDAACRRAAEEPWARAVDPLFVSEDEQFIAWNAHGRLRIWTISDGVLHYSSQQPDIDRTVLENGPELLIGQNDGRVKILDTRTWKSREPIVLPLKRIDSLIALPAAQLVAAVTNDAGWSYVLFEPRTGKVSRSNTGTGVLGPWSPAGEVATASGETVGLIHSLDGTRVAAGIRLKRSLTQSARPLAFTSDGKLLLVRSVTPITFGEAEPTLHIVNVSDGKEVLRFPMRQSIDADSISLDRDAPYPEGIFVDGTPDRVGATVYRNADAMWAVAASRAESRLTVWDVATGALATQLNVPLPSPSRLADNGRFVVTVPEFRPAQDELRNYALSIWSVGRDERLRLACLAADGEIPAAEWRRYIGAYTGEAPQATCAIRE